MSGLYECRPGGSCPICNAPDDEDEDQDYCPDCKRTECNCDEQYETYKDQQRGL